MDKERILVPSVPEAGKRDGTGMYTPAPVSNAIKFGNLVFTTAKPGRDPSGKLVDGIEGQTRQIMENLSALLKAAGTDLEHVLKTWVYVTDIKYFEPMNKVYSQYFKVPPARTFLVTHGWFDPEQVIEIEVVAGIP
ncbi:MAG TPA: RidA family protein [Nitrososphaerales archaeon]|nr:RidA family protein [Nitrososphaerales archaeon]